MAEARQIALKYLTKIKPSVFDSGIGARLPEEYRKFYNEWRHTTPEPVHFIPETGTWKRNEKTGVVTPIQNVPLPGFIPKELNQVFTGGEMVLLGFKKKKGFSSRVPRFWMPVAYKSVVYSEILNKYFSVLMTKRVVELIHKHEGFDNYIMQTKACDLRTLIALKFKRKLLFSLRDKELPYDNKKNESLYEKYKEYMPPAKEIEWYGLSFTEACQKQKEIEQSAREASIVPLKHVYRARLIEYLKTNSEFEKDDVEQKSWYAKLPIFNKLNKN